MNGEKLFTTNLVVTPYDQMLLDMVKALGGFYNAHAHLDRAWTLDPIYLEHINTTPLEASGFPLSAKQNITGNFHRGLAYTEDDLRRRMSNVLDSLVSFGTVKLDTCIDVTSDIKEDGLLAFRVAGELRDEFVGRLEVRIAPSPIFGFKKETDREAIFREAAKTADFLSALPEKDDFSPIGERDGKIGFRRHIRLVLELGCELGKEVHLHLDQANHPDECGTEILIEALGWEDVGWIDQPQIKGHDGPTVWVIHMISPSGYSETRFAKLANALQKHNIGVIVCPTAAISMRQLRPISTPAHSSIARVLELCKLGIPVRLGSDNICDVFVPQGDGNMLTEVKMAGHAVRFAIPHVWAKLAVGERLNKVDIEAIGRALYEDRKVYSDIDPNWISAVDEKSGK